MLTTVLPRRGAGLALVLDAVAVLVFAAVGRRSHGEGSDGLPGALAGLAHTAWPFLVALVLGWALVTVTTTTARRPRQRDLRAVAPAGVTVWATTVLVGHALRLVSGQGSAVSFLVVTAVVLGVLLLGWRALVGLLGRASRSPHGPAGQH